MEIPMRISQFNERFQPEIHQQEVSQVCISSVGTNINVINDHAVSITKLHKDVIHNNQSVNNSEDNQNKVSESSINFSIKRGLNQEEMASNVEKNLNTITTCSGITGNFTCFADKFSEKDIRNGIDASSGSQNSVESTDLNTAFIPTRFIKQELSNDINDDTVNIFCQSSSNNRMDEDSPVNIPFASNKHSSIDPKILQIEDDSNSLCLSKLFSSEKFNKKNSSLFFIRDIRN
ncbi:hypothetical protein CEXT_122561 [Caerostris extrusa]|uniref:Uncharacterized protein n=1 Tax=Caerostris extrusa TaxID=172846 RepID=A0AAV4UJ33_CAEEX|nr:hypothetical protein CEXT_122561 [Caerostris extrusa]